MGWDRAFAAAATYAKPEQFETFRRHIDAAWIEQALAATGTATVRRRRLPVEEVVWVVLGMALFRDRPIEDVVSKLDLALPGGGGTIARSSVSQARVRLGSEPMKWLFERSGSAWAHASAAAHRWRGVTLYGMDGSCVRVPDTPENREHFGGQSGRKGTESGYPMARTSRSWSCAPICSRGSGSGRTVARMSSSTPRRCGHRSRTTRSPCSTEASSRRRCCSASSRAGRTATG